MSSAPLQGGRARRRSITHCWLAVLVVAFALVSVPQAKASAGALDPSFGNSGRVTAGPGAFNAVALQPDGRVLVAGTDGADILVARYLPTGRLDASFGGDGMVTTDTGSAEDVANAVVALPEGKLAVAGTDGNDFVLARYRADGSLDPTFGESGIVVSDLSTEGDLSSSIETAAGETLPAGEWEVDGKPDVASALVALPDGRLVAGGSAGKARNPADTDFALARYMVDGSLDQSFGVAGVVITEAPYQSRISSMIMTGTSYVVSGTGSGGCCPDVLIGRYNDDGLLDRSFGPGGVVNTDTGAAEYGEALAATPGGDFIVAGGRDEQLALFAYTGNGARKRGFGTNGVVTADFRGRAFAIVIDDGKLLVAGSKGGDVALLRYDLDGGLDTTFGDGGVVVTDFEPTTRDVALAMTGNGDTAVIAGASVVPSANRTSRGIVARYATGSGELRPRAPRISVVQGDTESPASGIDPTPQITVEALTFGHLVRIFDGTDQLASREASEATMTLNAGPEDTDLVVEGNRSHSLTAVAIDQDGIASPASLPFVYVLEPPSDAVPQVSALYPSSGPTAGGTRVTVRGKGLAARDVKVHFGPLEALKATVVSEDELVAVAPPSAQGAVDVIVTNGKGTSAIAPSGRYTYGAGAWLKGDAPSSCGADMGCGVRELHTATALDDGSVLVAGGTPDLLRVRHRDNGFNEALDSSQLYRDGRWQPGEQLQQARLLHTATLLDPPGCHDGTAPDDYPCGSVLVAGGETARAVATASSELYDPKSPGWALTGELRTPRFSHTATLLRDGRVLVTGGVLGEPERDLTPLADAEVYDPVSGEWTPVAPLLPARANHTATLLPDGRVLVAGGLGGGSALQGQAIYHSATQSSASLYDPGTDSWQATSSMAVARFDHTATLIEGTACARAPSACGHVLVAGGDDGGDQYLASSEVYDLATGRWTPSGLLDQPRAGHTATMLANGTVLLAGGGPRFPANPDPPKEQAIRSASLFDPATSTWRPTSPMATPRGGHTATALPNGTVLVTAGYDALVLSVPTATATDTSEVYHPAPDIGSLEPSAVPAGVRSSVVVRGTGFRGAGKVALVRQATRHEPEVVLTSDQYTAGSDSVITVRPPPLAPGAYTVLAVNEGGTSLADPSPLAHRLLVKGAPAAPAVAGTALSPSSIVLRFPAVDDGAGVGPAGAYVIEQSVPGVGEPVLLCGGRCRFSPPAVGSALELLVSDLAPGTAYFYSVRAENEVGLLGDAGVAEVVTPEADGTDCRAGEDGAAARVRYAGGRYSLIGLPGGTVVNAHSPLYQWLDLGAGGSYNVTPPSQSVEGGLGYWAWFSCSRAIAVGVGDRSAAVPLGPYHAAMVGNPSGVASALVEGHDFAARWDPDANAGAGAYRISGYREPQSLLVGEGSWVFSYVRTTIHIRAPEQAK